MKAVFSKKNTGYLRKKMNEHLRTANQWLLETPQRALDQAYNAVLMIKAIEDEHFAGNKISADSNIHSDNVRSYLQADLEKHLSITKFRLAEFKLSRLVFTVSNPVILEKLRFIDEVLVRYASKKSTSLALMPSSSTVMIDSKTTRIQPDSSTVDVIKFEPVAEKTGVLPRSIGRTINKIKKELDPKTEEEVIKKFRNYRSQTETALRLVAMLIIVPVFTQNLSKQFLVEPIVKQIRGGKSIRDFSQL